MLFPHHVIHGPSAPRPAPPAEPADVPLAQFRAAQAVNASHLSRDGLVAYDERKYGIWRCFWDEGAKRFGSWYKMIEELPSDAAKIEK